MAHNDREIERTAYRVARKLRFGHLLLLDALERYGTLQESATQLRLSRSAVSKSLHEIELAAGSPLFLRGPHGIKPSAVGLIYVDGARRMLNNLQATVAGASHVQSGASALLKVGTPPFLGATLIPQVVRFALHALPNLHIRLMQAAFTQQVEALQDARLDCLLTSLTPDLVNSELSQDLHIEHLYIEHNRILAPRTAPWTRKRSWRLEELANVRWVMLPRPTALREALDRAFLHVGCMPPEPVAETNNVFSHAALAEASNALVLLQEPIAVQALKVQNLVSLNVTPVPGIGPIAFVTGKDAHPSLALDTFRSASRAVSASFDHNSSYAKSQKKWTG
ncbi:MAG: HTH-type transcriptional regulator GbpR [Nitrosomonadaceae bacterium]|nr:HTH-type transcriptional regulator GbpR [Nitrosomonadaceae bacterium]